MDRDKPRHFDSAKAASWELGKAADRETPLQTSIESQDRLCRVLIVEDHVDSARLTAPLLEILGYETKAAACATDALRLASAEALDVVVGDITLPDASGHEMMRRMWNRFGLLGVAVSGFNEDDFPLQGEDCGFLERLVKPIDVNRLHAAIQRVVRRNCSSRNRQEHLN